MSRCPRLREVPGVAAAGLHRVRVELLQFWRSGEAVFFTLGFPPIMLVLFGAIFGSNQIGPRGTSVTFSQYFTAGMIGTGVWTSCFQVLAIAVPLERDNGSLKRLKVTPMPLSAYFIGKIGMVTAVSAAETALLMAMGALFYDLQLPTGARWFTFAWVFVLGCAACTLTGIALAGLIRNGRVASSIVSPIAIVLQFVSGVYFVFGDLPARAADRRIDLPVALVDARDCDRSSFPTPTATPSPATAGTTCSPPSSCSRGARSA